MESSIYLGVWWCELGIEGLHVIITVTDGTNTALVRPVV